MTTQQNENPKKTVPPKDTISGLPEGAGMRWVRDILYVIFRYPKTPSGKRPVAYIGQVIDSVFYPFPEYAAHPELFPRPQRFKAGRRAKDQPPVLVVQQDENEGVFDNEVFNVEVGVPALLLAVGDAEHIIPDLTAAMNKVFKDRPDLLPQVKTVALFIASTGYSTWRIGEWCLQSFAPTTIVSQRVSELFVLVGSRIAELKAELTSLRLARFLERNKRREFLKDKEKRGKLSEEEKVELKQLGEHEFIAHDGTKLYSDARHMTFSQLGVSKVGEFRNLVTLSMLHSSSDGIPVAYEVRPGNLSDTETISDVQNLCNEFSIPAEQVWTVVDRNYPSAENLKNCTNLGMTTIAAVTMSNNYVKQVSDRHSKALQSCRTYNVGFRLNGVSEKVTLSNGTEVTVCVFFKARHRESARQKLMSKIENFKATWCGGKGEKHVDKDLKKFFLPLENGKPAIEDWDAIDQAVEQKGLFALVCTKPMSCWEALRAYKTRNCVEVGFKSGKQHADLETTRVHGDLALQGKMFVNFVALMLIAGVLKRMAFWKMTPKSATPPLNRNLSYPKLLDKMKSVRLTKAKGCSAKFEGVTDKIKGIVDQLRLSDTFDIQKLKERAFKL